jgi:TolB-like protein
VQEKRSIDNISKLAVRSELTRILENPLFTRSGRLGRFLQFTVESALAGKGDDLKEYVIGTEVYDRKPPYNPSVDSIVRTEARRLRAKLKEYYESDGKDDAVFIYFRPGSYVPVFRKNQTVRNSPSAGSSKNAGLFSEGSGVSVAVLPLVDLSGAPLSTLCANGLTEELTHALTQTDGIRVVSRAAVSQFLTESSDVSVVAKKLGLHAVIEGTVRQENNRLRITISNSNTEGLQNSSHRFETEANSESLPQVQEQIASAFISRARPSLSLIRRWKASVGALTLTAYPLALQAESLLDEGSASEIETALSKFEEITRIAPAFTRPFCGISLCHAELALRGSYPSAPRVALAKAAALHAVELDPQMIEAHSSLGGALAMEWDWAGAEKSFRHALSLGVDVGASRQYALFLTASRRFDEARHYLELAQQIDPFSYRQKVTRAKLLFLGRKHQEGVSWLSEPRLHGPFPIETNFNLALMLLQFGDKGKAKQLAESMRPHASSQLTMMAAIAEVLALCGETERAEQIVADFNLLASIPRMSRFRQALLTLAFGDRNQSLSFLKKAFEDHEAELLWIAVDPRLDSLRQESIFKDLVENVFSGPRT